MSGRYFGGKGEKSMGRMLLLFPRRKFDTLVDMFFGFGNISRLSSCGMQGVKAVGFEKDRSLFTLHSVIRDDKLFVQLLQRINSVENSKEYFNNALDIVKNYNSKNQEYDVVDVALCTLVSIRFSRDYKRNSWRNTKSYEGRGFSELEKAKKKAELDAIVAKFYCFTAASLLELNRKWKDVELYNEDCMLHMQEFCSDKTLYIADAPYLPQKRGISIKDENKKPKNSGYLEDMSIQEHRQLIDRIIDVSNAGASCMVCSLFEIDENGELVGVADDPYTKLLQNKFRMVAVKKTYSTAVARDIRNKDGKKIKTHKKPKVEVVYINYTDIVGSWANFKYWDYEDIHDKCVNYKN